MNDTEIEALMKHDVVLDAKGREWEVVAPARINSFGHVQGHVACATVKRGPVVQVLSWMTSEGWRKKS